MRAIIAFLVGTAAAGLITLPPSPAAAASIEIAPTTIDLPLGSRTAVFYVVNHGSKPIVTQVQGFDWRQDDSADRLAPSQSLMISPPMARLAPGQRQIVRLAIAPDAATPDEHAYRLLVSELPDPMARASQGIRILLQFSVPVFQESARQSQAHLVWGAMQRSGGLVITARNSGGRHVKLSNLAVAAQDGQPATMAPKTFAYILAGASHSWTLPARNFRSGETLHVTGRDGSTGAAIDASLVVAP